MLLTRRILIATGSSCLQTDFGLLISNSLHTVLKAISSSFCSCHTVGLPRNEIKPNSITNHITSERVVGWLVRIPLLYTASGIRSTVRAVRAGRAMDTVCLPVHALPPFHPLQIPQQADTVRSTEKMWFALHWAHS